MRNSLAYDFCPELEHRSLNGLFCGRSYGLFRNNLRLAADSGAQIQRHSLCHRLEISLLHNFKI